MKRRTFIRNSVAGAAFLSAFPYEALALEQKLYPHDRVKLGNTGIEMSRMAMGTGTHGFGGASNQTRQLGIKGVADLLRAGFDEGINFWETADQYGSHPHVGTALKKVEREKVVILTKTNSKTYEDVKKDLDRFRQELGTDYLDIILLHAITDPEWNQNMKGAMEALAEAKEEARVAIDVVEQHLEWHPDDVRALHLGAGSLIMLGQDERADEWLQRALQADPDDPIVLYNVACNYAIMGRVEGALDYLERVIENGTVSLDWMRNDSDLESLHGHPRYETLLAQVSN